MNEKQISIQDVTDQIIDDQRERIRKHEWLAAEEYLTQYPELVQSPEHVVDIIFNEFVLRNEDASGNEEPGADPQEFLDRFPQYEEPLKKQFLLYFGISHEFTETSTPDPTEFTQNDKQDDPPQSMRFELQEKLGEGGFATVFKAWDGQLKRFVAIKIAKFVLEPESKQFQRFEREAKSAARLSHPAIVSVHEFGNDEGRPFIVNELMEGRTLAAKIEQTRIPATEVARLLTTICDAVEYAHQYGIVHRDIKPANILFDKAGNPHLADFGLAALADSEVTLTQDGDLLGTPAYMSPEQARGNSEVGPASDIYSLGVVLYQLICGQLPFQGRSSTVVEQTISQEPPLPRSHDSNVPFDLQTICLKAISKEPSARYGSAREMAEDLRRYLNHEPIKARTIGVTGKLLRFCRRQPALATTIFGSVILIATITAVSFQGITRQRDLFRAERDRANAELFEQMVTNAESEIRSKQTGWYDRAMNSLIDATDLEVPNKDIRRQRELMIQALVDATPRFEIVQETSTRSAAVDAIAFDEQGTFVAAAYRDGTIQLLSFDLSDEVASLVGHGGRPAKNIVFASDSQSVFVQLDGEIWSWDLASLKQGQPTVELVGRKTRFDSVDCFAISSLDRIAIADPVAGIRIYPLLAGQIDLEIIQIEATGSSVACLDFSTGGSELVAAFADNRLRKWSAETGSLIGDYRTQNEPPTTLAATDQNVIWSNSVSLTVVNWELTGATRQSNQLGGQVITVGFSKHRAIAATNGGKIYLLGLVRGNNPTIVTQTESEGELTSLATSKSRGEIVAAYVDGTIRKWRLVDSDIAESRPELFHPVVVDNQDRFVCGGQILIPDEKTRGKTARFHFDSGSVRSMRVGAKTGLLVCGQDRDLVLRNRKADVERKHNVFDSIVIDVALSPDEQHCAAVSAKGLVRIWERSTWKLLSELQLKRQTFRDFALTNNSVIVASSEGVFAYPYDSPDNKTVLATIRLDWARLDTSDQMVAIPGSNNTIEIRKPETWEVVHRLIGHTRPVRHVELRPKTGQIVSMGNDNTVIVWDSNGKELRRFEVPAPCSEFAIDPSSETILFRSVSCYLCDFKTGRLITQFPSPDFGGSGNVKFSPDGDSLWFGVNGILVYRLPKSDLHLPTARVERTFDYVIHGSDNIRVWAVAVSPDGKWHAIGGHDRHLFLKDAKSHRLQHVVSGFDYGIWCADFSPDSKLVAIGSQRGDRGEITICRTDTGNKTRTIQFASRQISAIRFHPTLPLMAVSSFDGSVALFDTTYWKMIKKLLPPGAKTMHLEFRGDGKYLAAARTSSGVTVWPIDDSMTELAGLPIHLSDPKELIWGVNFFDDGTRMATVSESGIARFYSFPDLEPLVTLRTSANWLRKIEFTNDSRFMAITAFPDGGQIWDLKKLRERLGEHGLDW